VSEIARAQAFGLSELGHDVTVATGLDPHRDTSALSGKIQIHEFGVGGYLDPKIGYSGDIAGYQNFIASFDGDIILCNCWQNWATDTAIPVFSKTRAKKVILTQGFDAHYWHKQSR